MSDESRVSEDEAFEAEESDGAPTFPTALRDAVRSGAVWLLLLVALLAGLLIGWQASDQTDTIAELQASVNELESQLEQANADLSAASSRNTTLEEENDDLAGQIAGMMAAVPLPDYSGKTASDAESDAKNHGWTVATTSQASPKPEGTVLSQEPRAGTEMALGSEVKLVVAEPMPAQWYEVWSQSGSGRVKTPVIDLPDVETGNLRVTYNFRGTGHNALWLCNMMGEEEDLLHNEIGSMSNTSTLYISWEGCVFDIEGSGPWTVKLEAFGVPTS